MKKNFKNKNISIVGLGYVGLTLATVMANKGFYVQGIEKRKSIVDLINKGRSFFFEPDLERYLMRLTRSNKLKAKYTFDKKKDQTDVYIITVGTPIKQNNKPRLDMIKRATKEVATHMKDGALVILRSTVKIGTTRNIVKKILQKTGKKFDLAMCPERTLEGNALKELLTNPQIIGADTDRERARASSVFKKITKTVIPVSSLETAEIMKLVDNTYRDVNFAFSNEIARVCELFRINVLEVISSGKRNFKRTNLPIPGLVGGPCLEKDPHIFIDSVKFAGINLEITKSARLVNERQPRETLKFVFNEIKKRFNKKKIKIALLGIAFKGIPATSDLRGSMSLKVLRYIETNCPNNVVALFDPVISCRDLEKEISGNFLFSKSLLNAVKNSSVVIITNNHPYLSALNLFKLSKLMKRNGFIYDYWNLFANISLKKLPNFYYSVGNINSLK
jgi:UDP-N-acetyl-D-mannosaminuronic acid dehydrogenase